MKKNYISPKINVIQNEDLCGGGINSASVYKGSPGNKECISNFDVVNENTTKIEYNTWFGESNSENWGND